MKIGALSMEDFDNRPFNSVGSSRIRVRWLYPYWDELEQFQYGEDYDVVIYQKAYFMKHIRDFEGIKIFDSCDQEYPERPIVEVMEYVDAVTCSTQALADDYKKFTDKPVICIPDRLKLDDIKRIKTDYGSGRIKNAVWYGYYENFETLKPALPDLEQLDIDLTIISEKQDLHMTGYKNKITSEKYDANTIHERLADHDVVLNPRKNVGKWRLKSDNKTILAQSLGVPVAQTLSDLDRLQDTFERLKEANERYDYVQKNCDVRQSVVEYKQLINKLLDEKGKS